MQFDAGQQRGFRGSVRWQAGIFAAYFAQFVKTRLAYRMDFFVDTFGVLASIIIQLAVLTTLFSKVSSLQGWSFEQVLFIYGFSLIPLGMFNVVSVNLYGFADRYLIQGKFDRVLLRPVNTLAQVLCESFNVSGLNEIVLGTAIVVYAGIKLQLSVGPWDVLAVLVLAPTAALVYLGVFLAITAVSFWFEDKMGIAPPVYNVIRFSRYPLTIYSLPVRLLLTFVLPFAWVAYYPATWFVGEGNLRPVAALTPLVGIIVLSGAIMIWRRGEGKYTSTGS
ncbi:ABC transporter permease [bacterium]|nr:MAG: ABC transporter permease [bacterium]